MKDVRVSSAIAGNVTQSAVTAGFSEKASTLAADVKVQSRVRELQAAISERAEVDAEDRAELEI